MEEPRLIELPGYRVLKLRYEGPPPPDPAFVEHWKRFQSLTERLGFESEVEDVRAIGYAPPGPPGSRSFVYDLCVPVTTAVSQSRYEELEAGSMPGGRFVFCAGLLTELPALLREAKRFATSRGLAFERGRIEIYRPLRDDEEIARVDAGVRIHD